MSEKDQWREIERKLQQLLDNDFVLESELDLILDLVKQILSLLRSLPMNENSERRELEEIEAKLNQSLAEEDLILELEHKILDKQSPKLSYIKLAIGGIMPVGPAKLTVGDKKTLSVLGFDQFGAPIAIDFTANPVTFTDDNETALQDTAGSTVTDPVTALAPGVANVGATCAGFSDTEVVTVVAAAPVLSSIKVSID